jgi:hypothetical protein
MSTLTYLPNRPDEVLDALRRGEIVAPETAVEQLPDYFLLYAIHSGLLDRLADTFPDPRTQQPEIAMRLLLAAGLVGHFSGLYALSQSPYALHSPRLLAALGVEVGVNLPGNGLSRRKTKLAAPFHGDVVRKLLATIANNDKKAKRLPGQTLLDWYNASVGRLFCEAVGAEPILHILDCTDLTVLLENDHYELSGVTTKNQTPERGYKLATLRSLRDTGAVLTAIGWGAIEQHDLTVSHDLVRQTAHLKPGDTLLEDRGCLDAATITYLKKERQVEVCTGLKSDMNLLKAALVQANARPGAWQAHPTRPTQPIQVLVGLSGVWDGLGVAMNVCMVRYADKDKAVWRYFGFATTDLTLSAKQIILTYQVRPEIEEDYRQLKSVSWCLDAFCARRLVQILWHVVLTLPAYNLFQVYANTPAGRRFAQQTKQKLEREQGRNPPTYLLVCTYDAFGVYETQALLYILLDLPDDVRQKIRTLLPQRLN